LIFLVYFYFAGAAAFCARDGRVFFDVAGGRPFGEFRRIVFVGVLDDGVQHVQGNGGWLRRLVRPHGHNSTLLIGYLVNCSSDIFSSGTARQCCHHKISQACFELFRREGYPAILDVFFH